MIVRPQILQVNHDQVTGKRNLWKLWWVAVYTSFQINVSLVELCQVMQALTEAAKVSYLHPCRFGGPGAPALCPGPEEAGQGAPTFKCPAAPAPQAPRLPTLQFAQ